MYNYYDPKQARGEAAWRRQAAMERLMTIMDQRRQHQEAMEMNAKLEAEAAQAQQAQQKSQWDNMGSFWGSAAHGAAVGTAFGPGLGTGIGALAGGVLGLGAEMKNRHDFQKAQGKDYGWFDALGDTVGRAPNMNEVNSMLMSGASVGASMAGQHAATSQANADWAQAGNEQAAFERLANTGSADLNAATAGTYKPSMGQSYTSKTALNAGGMPSPTLPEPPPLNSPTYGMVGQGSYNTHRQSPNRL